MKKFVKIFASAAIIAMTALCLGCTPTPAKPVTPETPVDTGKAVTTEAELIEMGTELFEEINAYFEDIIPADSKRSAAPEEDPDVTAVMDFIDKIMEAAAKFEEEKFELTDASIDVKNLSANKILSILDSFAKKSNPEESIDNGLAELVKELEEDLGVKITVDEFKAKLNECVKLTKLKFNGNITAEPVIMYSEEDGQFFEELLVSVEMENVNEAAGVEVQKLSDLLAFITGSKEEFPVKNISIEESAIINNLAVTIPVDIDFVEPEDGPFENINEDKAIEPDDSKLDGNISVKTTFDFATTKSNYKGNLSLSFDLSSTTEDFQKFLNDSAEVYATYEAAMEALFEDLDLFGSVTVKVTNNNTETFKKSYKLGELVQIIMENMPEPGN